MVGIGNSEVIVSVGHQRENCQYVGWCLCWCICVGRMELKEMDRIIKLVCFWWSKSKRKYSVLGDWKGDVVEVGTNNG